MWLISGVLAKLRVRWRQFWCTHIWRPATTSKGPARWCEDCNSVELITAEEMYAYFKLYPKAAKIEAKGEAVTQEKLADRFTEFCDAAGSPCTNGDPDSIHTLAEQFARAELQKAAEIAEECGTVEFSQDAFNVAKAIRKLMD